MKAEVKNHLTKAKNIHIEATSEFNKAREDELKLRQVAEKGWLAINEAINALFVSLNLKLPRGTRKKEDMLFSLYKKDKKIAKLNLGERYVYFMHNLHIDAFYDGDVSKKRIQRDLRKVKEYIEEIEELINSKRGSF